MQNKIKELTHKNTKIEFIKYILVGFLNNIVYYLSFLFLIYICELHYIFAVVISYSISMLFGYFFNSKFSFQVMDKKNLSKYIFLYFASMVFNISILFILIDILSLEASFSQAIATIFVVFFNFMGLKFYVYKTVHIN